MPRLVDCEECDEISPQTVSALTALDSDIEHLAIVPEEITLRVDRRAYWESRVKG